MNRLIQTIDSEIECRCFCVAARVCVCVCVCDCLQTGFIRVSCSVVILSFVDVIVMVDLAMTAKSTIITLRECRYLFFYSVVLRVSQVSAALRFAKLYSRDRIHMKHLQ